MSKVREGSEGGGGALREEKPLSCLSRDILWDLWKKLDKDRGNF